MKRGIEWRVGILVGSPLLLGSLVVGAVINESFEARNRINATFIDVPRKQSEIKSLSLELAAAKTDLTQGEDAFELHFGSLNEDCRDVVRPFIVDGERVKDEDGVALRETVGYCPEEPTAVLSLRDQYDDLLVLGGTVTQLETSIAANLAAIGVQPPATTTQG